MRRRLWNQLVQAELLSIFHIELPGMIATIDSDTEAPRNLNDTEFDEESTVLPPSRPDTELTPVTYTIWKGRLCKVSGRISIIANRLQLPDYVKVMKLDGEILEVYSNIPSHFLQKSDALSITDPPDVIIKRLSIALLFHKSRCMLHRRYLTASGVGNEFDYSRNAAINTSMEILRLQALVHEAFLPGGILCRDRWFLSALSMYDFLVSGMIVYLSLIQSLDKRFPGGSNPTLNPEQQQMVELLKQSYEIWTHTDNMSAEMKRASQLIATLLNNLNVNSNGEANPTKSARGEGLLAARKNPLISGITISGNIAIYNPHLYDCAITNIGIDPPRTLQSLSPLSGNQASLDGDSTLFALQSNPGLVQSKASPFVETSSDRIMGLADDFDWVGLYLDCLIFVLTSVQQSFDNEFLPSYSMDADWNTLSPEDLLMGPERVNYY